MQTLEEWFIGQMLSVTPLIRADFGLGAPANPWRPQPRTAFISVWARLPYLEEADHEVLVWGRASYAASDHTWPTLTFSIPREFHNQLARANEAVNDWGHHPGWKQKTRTVLRRVDDNTNRPMPQTSLRVIEHVACMKGMCLSSAYIGREARLAREVSNALYNLLSDANRELVAQL